MIAEEDYTSVVEFGDRQMQHTDRVPKKGICILGTVFTYLLRTCT
jgi:hypothetical protein